MARDAGQGSCRRQCIQLAAGSHENGPKEAKERRRERACSSTGYEPITAHGAKIRADVIDVYVFRRGVKGTEFLQTPPPRARRWRIPGTGHGARARRRDERRVRATRDGGGTRLSSHDAAILGCGRLNRCTRFYIAAIDTVVHESTIRVRGAPGVVAAIERGTTRRIAGRPCATIDCDVHCGRAEGVLPGDPAGDRADASLSREGCASGDWGLFRGRGGVPLAHRVHRTAERGREDFAIGGHRRWSRPDGFRDRHERPGGERAPGAPVAIRRASAARRRS